MTFPDRLAMPCHDPRRPLASLALLAALVVTHVPALAASAPRVLRTEPSDGAANVDPGIAEIVVYFDRDMRDGSFSFVGGGPGFPEARGRPLWRDPRTCVLPIRLKPDWEYVFSINSERHHGFQGVDGTPATPMAVRFRTGEARRGAAAPQELLPAEASAAIEKLRMAVDRGYSYRDRLGLDWDAIIAARRKALEGARTPRAFALAAAELLGAARDVHIRLEVAGETVPTFRRDARRNFDLAGIRKAVPEFAPLDRAVYTGRFPDGTAYLLLGSLERKRVPVEDVLAFLRRLESAPALILDLRANGGGDEELAQEIAGCFVEKAVLYARHRLRDPDLPSGFTDPVDRVLQPAPADRPHFRGRVAVLQGRFTLSSAEALILMMRQAPGCVTIGETSYGSSGNPKPHDLGIGVTAWLPSWKAMDASGRETEGAGVPPDIVVEADSTAFRAGDPVIARALEILRGK